ncbi:dienelactone hydrolase endo- -beta-d-glucanase [Lentinula edodes]|uniref:Dienelactone hydrolase endo--beta-d-glucanase n=1 Tax=Lentinula edodes TaxID=5353 RepID=A0A1Q3E0A8_LENED|nr:dienelactone hydrolase endo- -beta-d-glucanase [Lentinula edodes]
MSSPFCDDCFKGVIHEGESKGQWESIGEVNCYVGTPSKDYDKTKAVLYLSDVFGMQLINNQLIVDSFADNGFLTIGIDYFNGDPVGENALGAGFSIETPGLKERGVAVFGAVGYCFGASYVFPLAIENKVKAAMIAHPARSIPESLQDYFNFSKAPLLINSCEFDPTFPLEACAKADDILGEGKFAPGYKRVHWEGCKHGFAVRGDMSDPKVKAGKEGAFKETVEWFSKYL